MKKVLFSLVVLVVLLAVILTSSPGCSSGERDEFTPSIQDWPMFRHDSQHTGAAISAITLPLTLQWSFEAGDMLMSSPAVSGDWLFVGPYGLTTATGKKRWEFQTEGPVTTSPAVSGDGGLVFIGSYEMNIYALNTATGKKRWEFQTDN